MEDQLKYCSWADFWQDGLLGMWNSQANCKKIFFVLPFFAQEKSGSSDNFSVRNTTQLFNSVRCLNLGDFQCSDLTVVGLPNRFRHFVFDSDELRVLPEYYKTIYPREKIGLISNQVLPLVFKRHAWNWEVPIEDGLSKPAIGLSDIYAPSRPGIVNSYILHSVNINGELKACVCHCMVVKGRLW